MPASDPITRESVERAKQQQRQQEYARQRISRDFVAGDAETAAERVSRADERAADDLTLDDSKQDRDGGTRSMTIQDRLEMETNRLLTRNEELGMPDPQSISANGRTR